MPVVCKGSPFELSAKGVTVAVRLQPGASQNQIDGLMQLDDGATLLKARVSAPPEKGKANAALIKLLAKSWRLPKSSIEVQSGQSNRSKILLLRGGGMELLEALKQDYATRDESY